MKDHILYKKKYDKYFTILIKDKTVNVSVDRLKPAYSLAVDNQNEQTSVGQKNEISNWKELSPMPDEQSTTSCGRKIKKKQDYEAKLSEEQKLHQKLQQSVVVTTELEKTKSEENQESNDLTRITVEVEVHQEQDNSQPSTSTLPIKRKKNSTERVQDISEHIPIEESLTAQQHTLSWDEEQYLCIAPGEQNVPRSLLFDEHAEELSFPSIYLGEFREIQRRN
ncbi:uncharacterized protein TNCV_2849321 [Trichonephila clavipes]|nr:uncharacterized protein TNCV_2849321 [Trichonephila clavipes]